MMPVCLPAASIQTLDVVRLFYDSMLGADAPPDSQIAASISSAAHASATASLIDSARHRRAQGGVNDLGHGVAPGSQRTLPESQQPTIV